MAKRGADATVNGSLVQPGTGLLRRALETAEGLLWPARGLLMRDGRGMDRPAFRLVEVGLHDLFPGTDAAGRSNDVFAKQALNYSGLQGFGGRAVRRGFCIVLHAGSCHLERTQGVQCTSPCLGFLLVSAWTATSVRPPHQTSNS